MTQHTYRLFMVIGSLCIANLACALDATALGVSLPAIASDLSETANQAFWNGASYLLALTVFAPTFTSLSEIFGRKFPLLTALSLFTLGSVVCASAPSLAALLIGRVIQGVGGGGIIALTNVIVTDLVPLRERGKWFGAVTMTWAVGTDIGPIIGGVLAKPQRWRYIFWINIPICISAFVSTLVVLRLRRVEGSIRQKVAKIDWVGSILFTISLTTVLVSLSWGGIMFSWTQWEVLFPLTVGVLGLGVFIFWSAQLPTRSILPKTMFKTPTALASYLSTTIHGMVLWNSVYYLPLYFEAVRGFSPIVSGVAQFPWTLTIGPLAFIVGLRIGKSGTYRWAVLLGWAITIVGVAHIISFDENTPWYIWIPEGILTGVGLGCLYPGLSFAVQASASTLDLPFAAGVFGFFRSFGQVLGVVFGGTIFQNTLKAKLSEYPQLADDASLYSTEAASMVLVIQAMEPSTRKNELIHCYVEALQSTWWTMAALSVLAAVIAVLFIKNYSLSTTLETTQGLDDDYPIQRRAQQNAPTIPPIVRMSAIDLEPF